MKKSINIADYLSPLVLVALILIWALVVWIFHIEPWILPAPQQVAVEILASRKLLLDNTLITVIEAIAGLVAACAAGISAAVLMHWSKYAKHGLYPLILLSQTIPFIALAPLLTIWFGFGLTPKILIVALVCFFPITINLMDGFISVENSQVRTLEAMGATKRQIFRHIHVPASLPFFFSGLRIATAYAFLAAVIAEWIGARNGLGILLTRASRSFLTDRVFATVAVITIISLLMVWSIDRIRAISIPWQKYI